MPFSWVCTASQSIAELRVNAFCSARWESMSPSSRHRERAAHGDDDDDDDVDTTRKKLLILVAKDAKTGTEAANFSSRKKVREHATLWLVSLLRQLRYRRANCKVMESHCPFVETVFRDSPIHATNVVESAMREVMERMVKIVDSHSILKWMPTMAADVISFFRNGKDGSTAEMRRWKKLVAEFQESVCNGPASKSSWKSDATKLAAQCHSPSSQSR